MVLEINGYKIIRHGASSRTLMQLINGCVWLGLGVTQRLDRSDEVTQDLQYNRQGSSEQSYYYELFVFKELL